MKISQSIKEQPLWS